MISVHKKRLIGAVLALAGVVSAAWWTFEKPTAGLTRKVATLLPKKVAPTVVGWPVRTSEVAGDGTAGLADGIGRASRFSDPYAIAMDASGTLYVADAGNNNRIRKITPGGVVSTLAGGGAAGYRDGPGAQAQFNGPLALALDKAGNVLVADTYNDRLRRIAPDGSVTTLAGAEPGNVDGPAALARFDTPSGVVVDAQGAIFIADSYNGSIRKLTADGQVTTVAARHGQETLVGLERPVSLAATNDGFVYVGDLARGRIWQIDPAGAVHGLTGIGIDISIGDADTPRLARPTGLALDRDGSLYVADSVGRVVRKLSARRAGESAASFLASAYVGTPAVRQAVAGVQLASSNGASTAVASTAVASTAVASIAVANTVVASSGVASAVLASTTIQGVNGANVSAGFPWPVAPQDKPHEIVGTVGECRGSYSGESRDHFHNGLDVQAPMGAQVLAVVAEKVSNPLPNWAYGDVGEGMSIDSTAYLHMRVGRTIKDALLDPARFTLLRDAKGKPIRVRVKRGTRFAVGDPLGTINSLFHVHLIRNVAGGESNPISLPFPGMSDTIAPRIDRMSLLGANGQALVKKRAKRLLVAQSGGPLALMVEAYDQMDGNAARRKLGLYKLGYQLLRADGTAMPGFEQPLTNIEFNRLPPDQESVKVAYADKSGITVYGNASTRFLYMATNIVRDGRAREGSWNPAGVPPGDYILRAHASDFAGNMALANRDLAITIE